MFHMNPITRWGFAAFDLPLRNPQNYANRGSVWVWRYHWMVRTWIPQTFTGTQRTEQPPAWNEDSIAAFLAAGTTEAWPRKIQNMDLNMEIYLVLLIYIIYQMRYPKKEIVISGIFLIPEKRWYLNYSMLCGNSTVSWLWWKCVQITQSKRYILINHL